MRRQIALQLLVIATLSGFGCAAKRQSVWVPPRVDLHAYGTLGMVELDARPGYGEIATRKFVASLHSAQPGTPVLELGQSAQVLRAVGREVMDPVTVRAIGEKYHVDVVVLGDLALDPVKPRWSLQSFTEATASAEIHGTLSARFYDAASGATIWSDSAGGRRTIAHLDLAMGSRPQFDAVDPDGEQAALVSWLVGQVTSDFRGHWERR